MMEIKSLEREDGNLVVKGTVGGGLPLNGVLKPEEARKAFKLIKGKGLYWFLLTFLFRS